MPDKVFGTFVETKLYKDDLDGEEKYVYIYFNKAKFTQDEEELMSILVLEKNNLMKKINNGEAILFDSDFKEKYPQFDVEYDEKNQVIYYLKISNEYLISKLKYSGFFVLVSNIKRSPEEMSSTYRKRDSIEKEFRKMKSQIGFNALNVQSEASLRSKVFIIFIASILRSYIMRKTTEKRNEDSKNYTVEACLKALSRIEATRNPSTNEYNVLYELTKHQKEILNCLGLTQKVVNKTYKY